MVNRLSAFPIGCGVRSSRAARLRLVVCVILLIVGTLCNPIAVAIVGLRVGVGAESAVEWIGDWIYPLVVGIMGWIHAGTLLAVGICLVIGGCMWRPRMAMAGSRSRDA